MLRLRCYCSTELDLTVMIAYAHTAIHAAENGVSFLTAGSNRCWLPSTSAIDICGRSIPALFLNQTKKWHYYQNCYYGAVIQRAINKKRRVGGEC